MSDYRNWISKVKINKTRAGVYSVTYSKVEAPLNLQQEAFADHGLRMISPAQLGFVRASQLTSQLGGVISFNGYSRTNADVFYDDRDDSKVIVVPDDALSKQLTSELVYCHKRNRECIIPESKREQFYNAVDTMLKSDTAFEAPHGITKISTSAFGQDKLASRLFSDESLEIKAQDYGEWLKSWGLKEQVFYFDDKDYAQSKESAYLDKLFFHEGYDRGTGFSVRGNWRDLANFMSALGVRFEKIDMADKMTDEAIHVIMAGGTIDSRYDSERDTTVTLENSGLPSYFGSIGFTKSDVVFTEIFMNDKDAKIDLEKLLRTIQESEQRKLIVTHRVCDIPDTARYLKANLKRDDQTVVLSGSMIPLQCPSSDAPFNLGYAISEVRKLNPGVYISMHAKTFTPDEVAKDMRLGRFYSVFGENL